MNQASLKEKVLLVTGASQGLGAEVAKACAAAGATVVLLARSQMTKLCRPAARSLTPSCLT